MNGACLVLDFDGTIGDTEGPVHRSLAERDAAHGHGLDRCAADIIAGSLVATSVAGALARAFRLTGL